MVNSPNRTTDRNKPRYTTATTKPNVKDIVRNYETAGLRCCEIAAIDAHNRKALFAAASSCWVRAVARQGACFAIRTKRAASRFTGRSAWRARLAKRLEPPRRRRSREIVKFGDVAPRYDSEHSRLRVRDAMKDVRNRGNAPGKRRKKTPDASRPLRANPARARGVRQRQRAAPRTRAWLG